MLEDADILGICRRIAGELNPEKIFLFGSYARGEATEESDVDLVVIADSPLPHHERNLAVRRLFPHRSFSLDAFVYTRGEMERYGSIPGTIVYEAVHNGKLLYG